MRIQKQPFVNQKEKSHEVFSYRPKDRRSASIGRGFFCALARTTVQSEFTAYLRVVKACKKVSVHPFRNGESLILFFSFSSALFAQSWLPDRVDTALPCRPTHVIRPLHASVRMHEDDIVSTMLHHPGGHFVVSIDGQKDRPLSYREGVGWTVRVASIVDWERTQPVFVHQRSAHHIGDVEVSEQLLPKCQRLRLLQHFAVHIQDVNVEGAEWRHLRVVDLRLALAHCQTSGLYILVVGRNRVSHDQ